jgi:hypothetical protein
MLRFPSKFVLQVLSICHGEQLLTDLSFVPLPFVNYKWTAYFKTNRFDN